MSDSAPIVPKLPSKLYLSDKERVADTNGNIWEYDKEKNEFMYKGQATTLPEVSEDENGLVTPDVQRTLELIQELSDQGYKFGKFRLKSDATNPYYFYFHSSDDLIKFIPEGQSQLRIEVDDRRLYQRLSKQCCVGPVGRTGEDGDRGKAGKPAAAEKFKTPKVTNGLVQIETTVAAPIDTPLSLRLFDAAKKQVAEFLYYLNGEVQFTLEGMLDIEESSLDITYDDATSAFAASIKVLNQDPSKWSYKVRQKGATGAAGVDGNPFIEIVDDLLPDPTLNSTRGIVSIRKSSGNNVVFLEKDVFEKVTVSRLSAVAGALPANDILKATLVAAEVTTRDSKDVGYFDIAKRLVDVDLPTLDLPTWSPQPGCGQRNRWSAFRFNWWDYADASYMFKIVPTSRPPEKCCEQDFFWCPNVGDEPCGVRGTVESTPTIEMPKRFADDCICECDNPIEFELQSGGFVFDMLDATTAAFKANTAVVVSQDAVIDGSSDRYSVDIMLASAVRVEIKVEPKPEVCGGPAKERNLCAFKDGSKIHCTSTVQDLTGGITFGSPQVSESENFPGTIEFLLDTQKFENADGAQENIISKARLVLTVNDTFVNLCRGYRVSVAVFKQVK